MTETPARESWQVLAWSTIAFSLLFSVWLMIGVLAIRIKAENQFTGSQMEWLIAAAILAGALPRLSFGIWADRSGGRQVMLGLLWFCAVPTYLFSQATTYWQFVACALLLGLAGNSFPTGISWNSASFPNHRKGLALGVFGAGNVGASGTKLLVVLFPGIFRLIPAGGLMGGWIPGGWRIIPFFYAMLLALMATFIFFLAPAVDRKPLQGRTMSEILGPLGQLRVWRFSFYYLVVFGAYLALSAWLPSFYHDHYQLELREAALLTAIFIFPASLLRPIGGWLADRYGPRVVTYWVFLVMTLALTALCVPDGSYAGFAYKLSAPGFTSVLFVVGCGMGIGKGSVFKYVPNYYPDDVGAVSGLVGTLGALGGFFMPPLFGFLGRTTGNPRMAFVALLVLTLISLAWLHSVVLAIKAAQRRQVPGDLLIDGSAT